MPRSWIPAGYNFTHIICPTDGGVSAFSAHAYVRSELLPDDLGRAITTPDTQISEFGMFTSRLGTAHCKVSQCSVPDNEQASLLLGTRVTTHMLEVLPEDPITKPGVAFILDSQCTCLTLNPALAQKERRRHNISVRTNRNLPKIELVIHWAQCGALLGTRLG